MPGHASSGTEWKAISSVERRAHILESSDSGKVTRMDNSRQMAEAGKKVRHPQLNEENKEWKMSSPVCYQEAGHSHKLLQHSHMASQTGGIRDQRGALDMALPVVAHLHPRNIPSYRTPVCNWQSWCGCGLSRVMGHVSTVFLTEIPLQLWVTDCVTVRILTCNFKSCFAIILCLKRSRMTHVSEIRITRV